MFDQLYNLGTHDDHADTDTEVELISLTTETLPHYKLRQDYTVRFSGYQHSDFKQVVRVKEQITELSNEQIHQTLEYFLLCGLRVSKMTETYEDCAALTLLVQEQRSHLDLAANIGLNLVEKNTQLEQRVLCLEKQLEESKDTIKQISYQLALKDDLLRMFYNEEESEEHNCPQTEATTENVFQLDRINVRQLELKLTKLEEENMMLRNQQHVIANSTDLLESKETQLVNDCVSHLFESTKTIDRLSLELNKKTNDYLNQHEEISRLLTTKIDLENRTHNLLSENDQLVTQLRDHQTKEFTLTKEISDMRDRYDECINLLNEKQDDIRHIKKLLNKETKKRVQCCNYSANNQEVGRSLAEELEESYKHDAEVEDHCRTMKIMDQARSLNTTWNNGDDETSSGFTEDLISSVVNMEQDLNLSEQLSGNFLLRRSIQDDCERRRILRRADRDNKDMDQSPSGTVTPHSHSQFADSPFVSEALYHRQDVCNGFSSLNSSIISPHQSSNSSHGLYRYPEKLQLVKPIEGSHTLRAWQNLATPSITKALFEDQPSGVCFRGQMVSSQLSSQDNNVQRAPISSGHDLLEEPPLVLSANISESHSNTYTYSNAKMSHSRNNMTFSIPKRNLATASAVVNTTDIIFASATPSSISNSHVDQSRIPFTGSSGHTAFTETHFHSSSDHSHHNRPLDSPSSSSWLNRFTVGSIMTSILGYSKHVPDLVLSTSLTSSPQSLSARDTSSSSPVNSSIIGRLTNLPPLAAKRKPTQQNQTGLNLLTSLASRPSSEHVRHHQQHNHRPPSTDLDSNNPLTQVD